MTGKKLLQLVCVAASLAALLWLLSRLGWQNILGSAKQIGWGSAVLLFAFALAENILDGLALRVILGPSLNVTRALLVNAAGSMMNLVLPWESGEVLKGSLLKGDHGSERAVSGTIIWNYIFKISRPALSLLTAVIALFLCHHISGDLLAIVTVANVLAFLPYVILRVVIRFGAAEGLVKVLGKLPYIKRSPDHWIAVARDIDRQVRSFWRERPVAYLQVFALQFLARVTGWLNIFVGFRAIGSPLSFADTTLMYATMNVVEYVIALLPARVGISEGTAFFVCKLYGFNAPIGLVVYTFLRMRNIIVYGVLTPFAFWGRKPAPAVAEIPSA
jgi:Lysylphosphatidylglycerol synthase TM region